MKSTPIFRLLITTAWLSIILLCSYNSIAQKDAIDITFTAVENYDHVQLDSIKVMNRTQGGDTVLYWPDTVLSLYYVGINEINKSEESFLLFQNYPNPVADITNISLFVPIKGYVSLLVTDILGRVILKWERFLDKGIHSFRFIPGGRNLFILTIHWMGQSRSFKILTTGYNSNRTSSLEYAGFEVYSSQLKAIKDIQSFPFNPGDELLYIVYENTMQSGISDNPDESQTYTFQFATNIPCPGTPTIEYEGQLYNTIQIYSQCWLKENLNVGVMIPGGQSQLNNGIIEKYCYDNEPDNCTIYGGIYWWDEMMLFTMLEGTQGICPNGWHLPTDLEWKILEGAVDCCFKIGDNMWDISGDTPRGWDVGNRLSSETGWTCGLGSDSFGFRALPGGVYLGNPINGFHYKGNTGFLWTSTWVGGASSWDRYIMCPYESMVFRDDGGWGAAMSVRCLRD